MTRSGRGRGRDREPSWRELDKSVDQTANRIFKITEPQRQLVAQCLRYVDDARRALEAQQNADNREIIRELKASADRIFDLMNDLEEIEPELPRPE
jgi:hypothetical protein